MANEALREELKRLRIVANMHSGCSQRLRAAQELAISHLRTSKEVQEELDEFVEKVKKMEVVMHDEAQKVITQHTMRTRVEVMMEHFRGEHASWDLGETVRIYNEAYPDDAFPLFVPEDVAPVVQTPINDVEAVGTNVAEVGAVEDVVGETDAAKADAVEVARGDPPVSVNEIVPEGVPTKD